MSNKNSISWQALEFKHYEKNAGWYVTLVSIAILIAGFFIIVQQDYFAAITIMILAALIVYFSRQKPEIVEIHLTSKGLHTGNLHIPYKQIKHFWMVDKEPHKTVNFETSTFVNRLMIVELDEQDPEEVRQFLLAYLPEHHETEPTLSQKVIHWLKF
ncbi:MAG: hypothetical protein HYZ51_04460 [Candidatus Doudnabacteria bacterium]|nr:hypothetical protein [Candidatus Doudnabacteria bacterium]